MTHKKRIWLIMARLEKGWSQKYVADELGIPQPTYSSYENGRRNPPEKVMERITKLLSIPKQKNGGIA